MKITPKTDKEITEKNLIPEGFYNYEIVKEEFGNSQNGNPRVHLTLKINHDGKEKFIWDDLCDWKDKTTKEFCYTQGLANEYEAGEIPDSGYKGKYGKIYIIVKAETTDKNGKVWKAKNEVTQYLPFDDRDSSTPKFDHDVEY